MFIKKLDFRTLFVLTHATWYTEGETRQTGPDSSAVCSNSL